MTFLDYLSGLSLCSGGLIRERGRQERESQRSQDDDRSRGQRKRDSKMLHYGFEEGGRSHEPRNVAVPRSCKILPQNLQKNEAMPKP